MIVFLTVSLSWHGLIFLRDIYSYDIAREADGSSILHSIVVEEIVVSKKIRWILQYSVTNYSSIHNQKQSLELIGKSNLLSL